MVANAGLATWSSLFDRDHVSQKPAESIDSHGQENSEGACSSTAAAEATKQNKPVPFPDVPQKDVSVVADPSYTEHDSETYDTTAEQWDKIMAVNSRGTFLCYKYAAMQMVRQGRGGRIIGAASVAGKMGYPFVGAYCASKFAVRGLTQAAAKELGKHGITVNAYAPGAIDSIMLSSLAHSSPKDTAMPPELWLDAQIKATPLERLGTANDVESLVSFIASQESQFITGQSVR
ncbi:hypothetical protein GGX14DRAFT_559519 [Mycena pura]|uniref:NAD(P)-binding protein n=1 Tax=Mycena pura TaxID=153505 RepID=A0AAD6VRR0_9AGAR|nr:hypothetical protein GGX14DRAFT_559519 [Mycena pura]